MASGRNPRSPVIKVLLTGFGPFRTHTTNASFEIVRRVYESMKRAEEGGEGSGKISVSMPSEPVRVSYRGVDGLLTELYGTDEECRPTYDLVVHTGLAASLSRATFSLEKTARRAPFSAPDVDGALPPNALHPAPGPPHLSTSISLDHHLLQSVSESLPQPVELRVSEDAGQYLCEYIYYGSLARYEATSTRETRGSEVTYGRGDQDTTPKCGRRPVLFVHVPPLLHPSDLALGAALLESLIREICRLHF